MKRLARGPFAAALAALIVFGHCVRFGFVYDDHWTIEHNRWLGMPLGATLSRVLAGRAAQSGIPDATRPTMALSTWIDHHLFGLSPAAYHLHSLLLYVLVVVLAWRVMLTLTGRARAAAVGAVFFALAPVHAEVVAAINYREDLLAAVGILVPYAALFARRDRAMTSSRALLLAVVWLVGLAAKESAIVLVGLIPATMAVVRVDRAWLRSRERALLALGAAALVWGNWRVALMLRGDDVPRAKFVSVAETIVGAARFETLAVARSFAPVFWSPEHGGGARDTTSAVWLLSLIAIIAACIFLAMRRAGRVPALALAITLIAPLASSPLARPVNVFADRYLFVAVLGPSLAFGWAIDRAWCARPRLAPAALVLLVPLAALAFVASRVWRSDAALWESAAARAPESARAWTGLSRVRRLAGDLDAADAAAARALSLDDTYLPARLTRAYNLLARGEVARARQELDDLVARGGGSLAGLTRARRCAELSAEKAMRCAGASP